MPPPRRRRRPPPPRQRPPPRHHPRPPLPPRRSRASPCRTSSASRSAAAHAALRAVGLPNVGLNIPCNKGTLASQSVVSSLSVAGKPPHPEVGAVPVSPGTTVAPGTRHRHHLVRLLRERIVRPERRRPDLRCRPPRTECRGPGVGLLLGRDGDDDDQHHGGVIDRFDQRWRGHDNDQTTADGAEPGPVTGCRAQGRRDGHHHHASLSPVSDRADAGDPTPTGALAEPLALSSGRGRWVIASTVLGSGIAFLDATVVGIALPSIEPRLPRGRRHAAVGRHRLRADAGCLPPPRGVAGRSLRPQADLLRRRRLVRRRIAPAAASPRAPGCSSARGSSRASAARC